MKLSSRFVLDNLFLLATVINALLGWPRWVSLIVAALVVLSYITLGGLSADVRFGRQE